MRVIGSQFISTRFRPLVGVAVAVVVMVLIGVVLLCLVT